MLHEVGLIQHKMFPLFVLHWGSLNSADHQAKTMFRKMYKLYAEFSIYRQWWSRSSLRGNSVLFHLLSRQVNTQPLH